MTEVRSTASGGVGLFATRAFAVGDVVLEHESPLIVVSPQDETASSSLTLKPALPAGPKQETPPSPWDSIVPPTNIPAHQVGNFRGMVQAAVSFAQQSKCGDYSKLFQLYRPTPAGVSQSQQEKEILEVSNEALSYLERNSKGDLKDLVTNNPDNVLAVMLIWSCNSFQGGRIYHTQSRINHSCNPNAVIQTDGERQCVRAAVPVSAGAEITISYLGIFLYADGLTRRDQLVKHKHFECACERCTTTTGPDVAAAIPCPSCHKRQGRYLDEDVQYDDENAVHYAIPSTPTRFVCSHCHETTSLDSKDPNDVLTLARTVSLKVVAHLEKQQQGHEVEEEFEEQLLQLASSVLGARHWTTNVLLLNRLDRSLKGVSAEMITTGNPPDLVQVAELIDSLQRLCKFVNGLKLELHIGHLLHNVVVGVARTLVTLGDPKSKKYASEWVDKVQPYAEHFESNDMKKVLSTLQVAWQKEEEHDCSNKRPRKS
jgi:hypothetical protein